MSQRRLLVDNLEQDKIKIIRINNPFDLDNSDVIEATYKEISSVIDYLPESDTKTIVSLNGKVLTDEECKSLIPSRNDCIVVKPVVAGGGGGSNILGILAMVALTVVAFTVAPMIGGWIGGGTGLTAAGAFTTASMIAFGAIMSIGGLLLGSLFQEDIPSYDNGSSSTTYGWGGVKALTGQGHPVAVTFGTVKTAGQVLSAHVTNTDDKQYLNILLSGGEGELDSITDIRIDGNPIANYDGVTYDVRLGTNNQTIIPNFNDTYADKNLSFILEVGNPATQQTDGDGGEGLKVGIDFPQGLYYVNNDGSASATSIHLSIDYRIRTSAPGVTPEVYGAWQSWISETITESKNSAVRKTYRKDNIPIGKYEVRVTKDSESGSTNRYVNTCQWSLLSHIIYDDFTYPRIALIGIKALATDQLSGSMPEITWKQSRANVLVWNPNTLAYENKPATNPAWAAYDVVHYCRKIYNINTSQYEYVVFGFPYSRIDYSAFKAWADFCDQPIESPSDLSALLTFNHLVDTMTSFWEALKPIENIGRGKVVLKGTKVSCIYDGVKSPTQQFTMGNIIKDSFNEEFLPMRDRANAIEITFFDETQNYERNTVYVYDSTFDTTSAVPNTSQITLYGCTRLKQAVKEGRYRLNLNKYLIRTITFDADIDSIACQIGDVINFQHDVPQWGWGGRIVSASSNLVVLDQEVELEAGIGYQIQVTLPDGTTVIKNVASVAEDSTTNILSITSAFTTIPAEYASYAFGKYNISTKPFRVIGITRSADFRRRITAIEYIKEVYDNSEIIPEIPYSDLTFELTNLLLTKYVDSYGLTYIHMSWNTPKYSYGGVIITVDGIKVAKLGSNESSYNYLASNNGTYTVKLQVLDYFGVIRSVVTQLVNLDNIPLTPSGLTVTISDQVYCKWNSNPSTDVDFYELRLDTNYGEVTNMLFKGMALSSAVKLPSRAGTIYLYAHSSSGYYSSPLVHIYNFPAPPAPTITLAPLFQGFTVTTTTFPSTVNGISVHINDGSGGDEIYLSPNNRYDYKTTGGIFDVSVAFTDVFGEGEFSPVIEKVVYLTIDPSWVHISENTVFENNVIVNSMLAANAITADKISSLVGVSIPHTDGSTTKFESDGINWYTSEGVKHGSVKRAIQGTALNGKFIKFNTPWQNKPFIILSPKSVQSMVSGYTNSNLQIVCEPYSNDALNDPDMKTGFRIRLETRVLDGSGGSIIDLSLPSNGSEQISPATPLATKDLYATVEVNLGSYTAGYFVATNPDHNLWHNRQDMDPYSTIRDTRNYVSEFTSNQYPITHSIGLNTEHRHTFETYMWYGGTWTWVLLPGGDFTHYHRSYVGEVYTYGTITLNFYYRLVGAATWTTAGSKVFSSQYGVLSHTQTVATGLTPGQYQIKVVRSSSSGVVNSAKFKSYSVNGGGVIASTGEVSFLAIESDGNSFYTVEN